MSTPKTLDAEHDELLFAVRRSVRYHRHRERFFYRVHQLGILLTAVAGTATVATLLAELPPEWTWLRIAAAALTALGSATELILGAARGAREHSALAVSFVHVEKELLRSRPAPSAEVLNALQSRRLEIEASAPPIYRVLEAVCHDELVTALGRDPCERRNVTTWQRLWRHVVDIRPHTVQ